MKFNYCPTSSVSGILRCLFLLLSVPIIYLSLSACPVYAQTAGIDVTTVYTVQNEDAKEGDIVKNTESGIDLTDKEYEQKMFGVIQNNPLLVFRNVDGSGSPVVRNGTSFVNVTNLNGEIKQGDFITSSVVLGKGQKATKSGYIIGTALEDFKSESGTSFSLNGKEYKQGKIQIAIRIEFAEIDRARSASRLFELIDAALFSNVKNPDQFIRIVRYAGSVAVIIATALFAYLVFAKTITNGIQAIGRNPLAKRPIQITIVLNIIFTSIVIILGIIGAFVLLRA